MKFAAIVAASIVFSVLQQQSTPRRETNQKPADAAQSHPAPKQKPPQSTVAPSPGDADANAQRVKGNSSENIQVGAPTPEKAVDPVERGISIVGVVCTLILAGVGVRGIFVALDTLREMKGQREQMGRQVEAAILQVEAMHKQITEMSEQTKIARQSASAAQRSVEIVISKERARVRIEPGELDIKKIVDQFWFASVDIQISNLGPMKALPSSTQYALFLTESSEPTKTGILAALVDSSVILPDQIIHKSAHCIFGIDQETIQALNESVKFMHLYGDIRYTDVFGEYVTAFRYVWKVSDPSTVAAKEALGMKMNIAATLYGSWKKNGSEGDNAAT